MREETRLFLAQSMTNSILNGLKEESKETLIEVPKRVIQTSPKFMQFRKVIEENPKLENAYFYI